MPTPSEILESAKRSPERDMILQLQPPKRRIRRKGCLQALLDAPSDLFSTVASYCEPRDLLSMARSCKMLRGVLMSKQSRSIWIESCKGIALPACPPDLSEPQYVELMFGNQCYHCSSKRIRHFSLKQRYRMCTSCWNEQSCPGDDLSTLPSMLNCALDEEEIQKIGQILSKFSKRDRRWYIPQLQQMARRKKELTPEDWCSYLDSSTMQWILSEAFEVSIEEMSDWSGLEHEKKTEKKRNIKDERRRQIEALLIQEGFSKKIVSSLQSRAFRSSFNKIAMDTRPLTKRIWERMKPELTEFILKDVVPHHEELARLCDTIMASSTLSSIALLRTDPRKQKKVLVRERLENYGFHYIDCLKDIINSAPTSSSFAPESSKSAESKPKSVAPSVEEQVPPKPKPKPKIPFPEIYLAPREPVNDNEYDFLDLLSPIPQAEQIMLSRSHGFPDDYKWV